MCSLQYHQHTLKWYQSSALILLIEGESTEAYIEETEGQYHSNKSDA